MNNHSPLREHIRHLLLAPNRGVPGLVDDLLAISGERSLQVLWQEGRCCVRFLEGEPLEQIEVPLPKSVIRAALARVAALCNERSPGSVSPYGGQGEVTVTADPARTIHVTFINTPEEQRLEMSSVRVNITPPVGSIPAG